jgi:phosphohistidine phosphatase
MNHMGKTLFIVRHGEARHKESGEKDQDRMLEAEGLRQSSRLGVYLYNKNTDISAIICSHAKRAQQTAEQISDQLSFDLSKIIIDEELYEASVRIILDKVTHFSNEWNEVIIVGHNPVLSYFVEYITGHHFDGMESGSVVKIACNIDDWMEVSKDNSSFEYYASPEDY